MNRLFLVISIVLCFIFGMSGKATAQMVQNGKVVEGNSKGKPLSFVSIEVDSVHDCQPQMSDASGKFKLRFASHKNGDEIWLHATKKGYEVVNIHVTRGWTLSSKKTLLIIMAPRDSVNAARKRYYDVAEAACKARYDSTMNVLNEHYANHVISMPQYQFWKVAAENELQQAYQSLEVYADVFARLDEYDEDKNNAAILARLKANDILGAMALASDTPCEDVLQAYTEISLRFPLESFGEMELTADIDSMPVPDTLYEEEIMVLQTYVNLFEKELLDTGMKYAKSCAYLGVLYREKGWDEASRKYLQKSLKMFEMLNLIDGIEVEDKIDKIRGLLNN